MSDNSNIIITLEQFIQAQFEGLTFFAPEEPHAAKTCLYARERLFNLFPETLKIYVGRAYERNQLARGLDRHGKLTYE